MSVFYLTEQLVRDRHETLIREAEAARLAAQLRGVRRVQRRAARLEVAAARATARARALASSVATLGVPAQRRSG